MSKVSERYTAIVEKWLLGGLSLERMNLTPEQRLRTRLCYEAYQVWIQNKQIRPAELLRNIANREYPILIAKAENGDAEAMEIVRRCNIVRGKSRTITEISNDVAVLDWLVGRFDTPTEAIEKAKVTDASDWLIAEGKKMGLPNAVAKGADMKLRIHDNFQDKTDAKDQMPDPNINITGDVSIIKSDRVNYTEEEIQKLSRKFGVTVSEFHEMQQQEDGSWAIGEDDEGVENEAEIDPFLNV